MTGLKSSQRGMFAQLQTFIISRIPVIWLLTSEEQRAERGIASLAANLKFEDRKAVCAIWSLTGGKAQAGGWEEPRGWQSDPNNGPPLQDDFRPEDELGERMAATPNGGLQLALNWALKHPKHPSILIVRDAHNFLGNDYWRRVVKDATVLLRDTLTTLVCVSVSAELPDDLRREVAILKPGLPTLPVLEKHVKSTLQALDIDADSRECAAALRGLSCQQATDLVTLDYTENKGVSPVRLSKLKATELASVHGVHFKGEAADFAEVGGFTYFKSWMRKRRWAFGQDARDEGIDKPKGVVFVGVPGGGKTLMGAAAAGELGLPLIILNLSECEGGIVGETATRTAEALRTVDALAPCVVLVDEVEKIFGGPGNIDGGSKSGMMRLLLIWLQERESECFTMLTSNDISSLPPELTRRGRVDEIWFCDLPNLNDRKSILNIHLAKRNRSLNTKSVASLAKSLVGFTGSEIEQVCKEAHLTAYCRKCEGDNGKLTQDDLKEAAATITPIAVTYQGKLGALRAWAKGRARYASAPDPDDQAAEPKAQPNSSVDPGEAPAPGTQLFDKALDMPW